MPLELYLAFVAATAVLILIPGAAAAVAREPGPGALAQPGDRRPADRRGTGIGAGTAELNRGAALRRPNSRAWD